MKKLSIIICIFYSFFSYAQKVQFKDKNFEKAILEEYDKNHDNHIDENEKKDIKTIHFRGVALKTYDDIYQFDISKLIFEDMSINKLIIRDIPTLRNLFCTNCNLTLFEIENLTNLGSVYISNNSLKSFSIKNSPKLYSLDLSDNLFDVIEVNHFVNLESLYVSNNSLQNLNVQNLLKLKDLRIHNNKITKLDLSKNINLNFLYAFGNNLKISDIIKPYEKNIWINLKEPIKEEGTIPSFP
ncbi:leucine-rich repeat domain-containing protein [Chryseobacterium echinoideorum]|uniref:leucine-rich repeat domain-containing protein n=1 Tax=Chryseobacterium echinoideorum TaxID=1549648 RepID=UPI001184B474|nr:leucine-rich repeat domain-containing protein [Chryseobacterium echinoideorum]